MSVPLVLDLHGAGGDPLGHWVWSGMRDCALQRGWHVAYPAGVGNTWNAGPGMYAPASGSDVMPATDHVGNLSSLANRMRTSLNASRVFVTGISNGCAMALRLGLEAYAGTIDAVACNGHKMHPSIRTREPPEPRPLLLITGSHDPWFADPDAVHNTLHEWMINNNCTGTLNSNSTFGNVTVSDAGSCRAAVRHVLFHGAGHIVPLHRAAEMQCEFLERYV
jgi:poly(3-hydroxybutyrate) depolymerase